MQQIKITGIIQLQLDDRVLSTIDELQEGLPEQAKKIKAGDIHVTLWKLTKEEKRTLEEGIRSGKIDIPPVPEAVEVESGILRIDRAESVVDGRIFKPKRAWILNVQQRKARMLREYVDAIAKSAGIILSEYEKNRPFHVSIANLTGSPFDSVGDVKPEEIMNG